MTAGSIARDSVVTVEDDATLVDAAATMRDDGVGSVVVVDGDRPVGILTDRDLAVRVVADGADPATTLVADAMADDLVTVESETGVYELVRLMAEESVRRVPVVEDDTLVGIVSVDDVIVLLGMELQNIATLIRAESPSLETPATELPEML
ncbi:MAG: CBS domain-containing protein [Halobacteriales archaeon]